MLRRTAAILALFVALLAVADGAHHAGAAHPGENGRIAFALQDGESRHIWTMEPDGSDRQQITTGAVEDYAPHYSPDGTKIAFRRNEPSQGIFVVDADGGNLHFVPATDHGFGATWSPDSARIAFGDETTADILTVGINGDDPTNLTDSDNAAEFSPDWSPDGERIAFIRYSQLDGGELWTMDTAGLNRQKLTTSPALAEDQPDWSPDGTKLVFDVYDSSAGDVDVAVINATGGDVMPLAATDRGESWPSFSPDGEHIAFMAEDTLVATGSSEVGSSIVVMAADGSDPHSISTIDPPFDETPDWGIIPGTGARHQTWGDNDCSGIIDEHDALNALLQEVDAIEAEFDCPALGALVTTDDTQQRPWADVNCSGTPNFDDALVVLRYVANLPDDTGACPQIGTTTEVVS